jgi:hypothetical protein
MYDSLFTQSVCGSSPSSLSLAVSIAMRISASALVRFGLNAFAACVTVIGCCLRAVVMQPETIHL